jgi:hypothetical protein
MRRHAILITLVSLAVLGLVAADQARAQCGHPPNCNFPNHMVVCPSGDIHVVGQVLDINGNPCVGTVVHMLFHPPAVGLLWSHPTYPYPMDTAVTNLNGTVTFRPMLGGCSMGGFVMFMDAAGVVLGQTLTINSPDINADGIVNLTDVATFANAFFGGYTRCSDFNMDGVINLSDLGVMASHLGH